MSRAKKSELTGHTIKLLRISLDFSQEDMGTLLGVSQKTISVWESTSGAICLRTFQKEIIQKLLEKTPSDYNNKAFGNLLKEKLNLSFISAIAFLLVRDTEMDSSQKKRLASTVTV